jgi:hypothetical protein
MGPPGADQAPAANRGMQHRPMVSSARLAAVFARSHRSALTFFTLMVVSFTSGLSIGCLLG